MFPKITSHFERDEFFHSNIAFENGIVNFPTYAEYIDEISPNIVFVSYMLEIIRAQFNHPICITSGYRCKELNKLVGGSPTSNHLKGLAVDINCGKELNKKLYDVISNLKDILPVNELINENNYSWIHVSFKKL